MKFTYKKWERFCEALSSEGRNSITAKDVLTGNCEANYIVLKHDVETAVDKAYKMAVIEKKYGHRGSYYVQAYLLENPKNVQTLVKMQEMGHEITYHYDVMDSNKGNVASAIKEFETNKELFEKNGFYLFTVCQHGNPIIERKGYASNRDFFRSNDVQKLYKNIADIMVDYPQKAHTEYNYYSDAGRRFQKIFDPFTNDIVNSDDKNLPYDDLNMLLASLQIDENHIISVHPHRWTKSSFIYSMKNLLFNIIKKTAQKDSF